LAGLDEDLDTVKGCCRWEAHCLCEPEALASEWLVGRQAHREQQPLDVACPEH
jgi:hypothetical protein